MLKRKSIAMLLGSLLGITAFAGIVLQPLSEVSSIAEFISGVFQIIPFAFLFIILYGGLVTLFSESYANRYDGHKRILISFVFHVGFGLLFGVVARSNVEVSLFGLEVDLSIPAATIIASFIWGVDELLRKYHHKQRFITFTAGIILFILTIPYTVLMTMDAVVEKDYRDNYTIRSMNNTNYTIGDHTLQVTEDVPDNQQSFIDRGKNKAKTGEISVLWEDTELVALENAPIRIEWDGMARYYGQLSILQLTDKEDESKKLIVIVKDPLEETTALEERTYTYYEFDSTEKINEKSFRYNDRNHYETFLLQHSSLTPSSVSYYGEGHHTPAFPIFSVLSALLVVWNWPKCRKLK